jgi:integrase
VEHHKRFLGWTVDCQPKEKGIGKRYRKTFGPDVNNPKALAEAYERDLRTDFQRGELQLNRPYKPFIEVSQEWWDRVAIGQKRIKTPMVAEIYYLREFQKYFGKRAIGDIKLRDGEDWIEKRLALGRSVRAINRYLTHLNVILKYAVDRGYIADNPLAKLKKLKGANIRKRWLSEAEIDHLLGIIKKQKDMDLWDIVMIALNTGFRKGNLERLEARHISGLEIGSSINAEETKTGNPYDVPVTEALQPILARLIKERPTGKLLRTDRMQERFNAATIEAGFYTAKKDPNKVTIHTLRHTFAALYLQRGGDALSLRHLMGHTSTRMVDSTYGHLSRKHMMDQASKMGTKIASDEDPPQQMLEVI